MSKSILLAFEEYQKARSSFVQTIAELSTRPQNIDPLMSANVLVLLRSLISDAVPSIAQSAMLALGRLANFSDEVAEAIVTENILTSIIACLSSHNNTTNVHMKKAACLVLRSVARHTPALAQAIVDAGALEFLSIALTEFDPGLKESAAFALSHIARHSPELALHVADNSVLSNLVLTLQDPELALKRVAATAIGDIAKHSVDLATAASDCGAISNLANFIQTADEKLRRQVLCTLASIAKHSVELSESVIECDVVPRVIRLLKDRDFKVRKNAAILLREVAKMTPENSALVVNHGAIAGFGEYIKDCLHEEPAESLPAVMAIGFISAFSATSALAVIVEREVELLLELLVKCGEDHVRAATVWTLGQIGKHTPEHAKALNENGFPAHVLTLLKENCSEDLVNKSKRALKSVIQVSTELSPLDCILKDEGVNAGILLTALEQYAKILPSNVNARKAFVTTGALQRIQEILSVVGGNGSETQSDTTIKELISVINACFPEDIVRFYSPGYSQHILQKVESFEVKI
ncbi:hypothetical protein RCL1_006649 [Eukaryota sp. TZLM3-RCL]